MYVKYLKLQKRAEKKHTKILLGQEKDMVKT